MPTLWWVITKKQTIFKHAHGECYYTYWITTDKSSNYLPPSKQLLPISVTSVCHGYKKKMYSKYIQCHFKMKSFTSLSDLAIFRFITNLRKSCVSKMASTVISQFIQVCEIKTISQAWSMWTQQFKKTENIL